VEVGIAIWFQSSYINEKWRNKDLWILMKQYLEPGIRQNLGTLLVEATWVAIVAEASKYDLKFAEGKGSDELDQGKWGFAIAKACRSKRKKKDRNLKSEGNLKGWDASPHGARFGYYFCSQCCH
jgi:hypothetical protein